MISSPLRVVDKANGSSRFAIGQTARAARALGDNHAVHSPLSEYLVSRSNGHVPYVGMSAAGARRVEK